MDEASYIDSCVAQQTKKLLDENAELTLKVEKLRKRRDDLKKQLACMERDKEAYIGLLRDAEFATGVMDAYSQGMCNGLVYARAMLEGKEPIYHSSDEWKEA